MLNPNPIGGVGLPFAQITSDQPETFPLLICTIDNKLTTKNFDKIPGRSHDCCLVRNRYFT